RASDRVSHRAHDPGRHGAGGRRDRRGAPQPPIADRAVRLSDLPTSAGWQASLGTAGRRPMKPADLAPPGTFDRDVGPPSNVLLLRGHGMTGLIDASSGSFATGWPGAQDFLVEALGGADCAPTDVDLVVLTHLDFDHCGGCIELPRARVVAPKGAA